MYAPHASGIRLLPTFLVGPAALLLPIGISATLAFALRGTDDVAVSGVLVALLCGTGSAYLIGLAWRRDRGCASLGCRCVGFHGAGLGVVALTGLIMAVTEVLGASPSAIADVVAGGLILATVAFVPGLLLMPGGPTTTVARIRRALDGVGVGVCLLFTGWVVLIAPKGDFDGLGFWMTVLTCCLLAIVAITAIKPNAPRRAAALCAGGVASAVIGFNGTAFGLANELGSAWLWIFTWFMVAAAGLVLFGIRSLDVGPTRTEAPPSTAFPLLTVPLVTAVVVAVHRLVVNAPFDRPSVVLGIVAMVAVAVRESLASRDVARYARRVVAQESQFRSLVAGSSDVIMVLGPDLVVRWQSTAAARQFCLSDQEVVGRNFQSMLHPEDAIGAADRLADVRRRRDTADETPTLIEARMRDGFGRWRETESSVSDLRDVPEVAGLVVHIRDVSERKDMERTLHRLAYADQLTGLANRRQLMMSIVAQRCAPRARGALLIIELDGFNAVNDVRGFDIGDAVLVEVARRLRVGAGDSDLPARLSGDEFAVMTEAGPVQAYALATRLLTMLAEPISLPGVTVHLSASIGLAELASAVNGDDVLRRADLALRRAKQLGRGRVEWFDPAVEEAIMRRMTIEQELPDALLRGELDLMYQPILDLVEGRPMAVEALLRWRHPEMGTLLPHDVIPVAEDLGLMPEIGSWVMLRASRQLAAWLREGRDLSMAVNVSPHQLLGTELVTDVATVLDLHGFPAERLVLEVAEGGIGVADNGADTGAVAERVGELRSLGIRTALDEFGTGVRSLTYLRGLPLDMVKIGPTFFDQVQPSRDQTVPLIDVMVNLGRQLGIEVVAQGLEAPSHLEVVRVAGCRLGQGHLFARPQPAERTEAYLDGFPGRAS